MWRWGAVEGFLRWGENPAAKWGDGIPGREDKVSQSSVAFIPRGFPARLLQPRDCTGPQGHYREPRRVPTLLGVSAGLPREGDRGGKWEFCLQTRGLPAPGVTVQLGGMWGRHLGTLVSPGLACPMSPPGSQGEPWTPAGTNPPSASSESETAVGPSDILVG